MSSPRSEMKAWAMYRLPPARSLKPSTTWMRCWAAARRIRSISAPSRVIEPAAYEGTNAMPAAGESSQIHHGYPGMKVSGNATSRAPPAEASPMSEMTLSTPPARSSQTDSACTAATRTVCCITGLLPCRELMAHTLGAEILTRPDRPCRGSLPRVPGLAVVARRHAGGRTERTVETRFAVEPAREPDRRDGPPRLSQQHRLGLFDPHPAQPRGDAVGAEDAVQGAARDVARRRDS